MHYIPGTTFEVLPMSRGKTDISSLEANRSIKLFPIPGEYEVYYIARDHFNRRDGLLEYTFRNKGTGDLNKIEFKSTAEADKVISRLLNEDLPDYDSIYLNQTD